MRVLVILNDVVLSNVVLNNVVLNDAVLSDGVLLSRIMQQIAPTMTFASRCKRHAHSHAPPDTFSHPRRAAAAPTCRQTPHWQQASSRHALLSLP